MQASYKPEIDGLRALAIIPVVLFHAWVPGFSGGFLGVDVFFAISGYLIIGQLHQQFARAGRIAWMDFYARRLRRLLPMTLLVLLLCTALMFWLLPPTGPQQAFAKAAMATALFMANIHFAGDKQGYFESSQEQMPLLHMWSLGVEEQFYIGVPLLFLLMRLTHKQHMTPVRLLAIGTIFSLLLCIWGSVADGAGTMAFYLPFTRAWEFGLGGLAAITPWGQVFSQRAAKSVMALALAGLFASLALLNAELPGTPLIYGSSALATALLLWAMQGCGELPVWVGWLRHPLLVWIGQRSYGWYLLHWPALVFYRHYWLEDVSWPGLVAVAMVSLLLAAVFYQWVEQAVRHSRWLKARTPAFNVGLALVVLALVAPSLLLIGFYARHVKYEAQYSKLLQANLEVQGWAPYLIPPNLRQAATYLPEVRSPENRGTLLLWGDSHANAIYPAILATGDQLGLNVVSATLPGCPPLSNILTGLPDTGQDNKRASARPCSAFEQAVLAEIRRRAKVEQLTVVMTARWPAYLGEKPVSVRDLRGYSKSGSEADHKAMRESFLQELRRTMAILQQTTGDIRVLLMSPVPSLVYPAPACEWRWGLSKCSTSRREIDAANAETLKRLQEIVGSIKGIMLINPIDAFCDLEKCYPGDDQGLWYTDDNHLNAQGARRLIPLLLQAMDGSK